MPPKAPFVHKLLKHLDHLDRESVQNYLLDLTDAVSRYEEILDHLSEGVILLSPEGRIQGINRQASLWLGVETREVGRIALPEILKDSELARFVSGHLPSLKQKVVGEIAMLAPREMRLRAFLIPLEPEKSDRSFVLILLDRSSGEKSSAEDERLQRIESLVSLAAGVAHEIGNPLNAIDIHLQLLKKEIRSLPEAKRTPFEKTIEVLQGETSRLDKIIRNFLKATRMPPLRLRTDDLNSVAEQALHFMEPELKRRKITTDYEPCRILPFFHMDRARLYQAFINLIKNAMEAMPGGGLLKIRLAQKDKVASIAFKDEGSGIAGEDMPHIFESYYTTKEEGSGLGLVSVFNTVRDHGGRIEVTSKVGKGTTFTLLLPMRQPKLQLPQYKAKL